MSHAKGLAGTVPGRGPEVGTSLAISELEGGDRGESLVTDGDGGTRGGQRGRSCAFHTRKLLCKTEACAGRSRNERRSGKPVDAQNTGPLVLTASSQLIAFRHLSESPLRTCSGSSVTTTRGAVSNLPRERNIEKTGRNYVEILTATYLGAVECRLISVRFYIFLIQDVEHAELTGFKIAGFCFFSDSAPSVPGEATPPHVCCPSIPSGEFS